MKNLKIFSAICLMLIITSGCEEGQIIPGTGLTDEILNRGAKKGAEANQKPIKVTGSVELTWKGADKGSNKGNKPEDLLTFLDINAHEGTDQKNPKGEIVYTVLETDYTPHREIIAEVYDVEIFLKNNIKKAKVVAMVISDSKGCAGDGNSGHDDNCGGSSDDPSNHDGGCSHDDPDDGGCSHDDPDDGGCSHDDPDDGGCSHDDPDEGDLHEEPDHGGCSGSDSGPDTHGGSPGGGDTGNPMSGKNCRTGQIIALITHDGGSPGKSNDVIGWKWFAPEAAPELSDLKKCGLCEKEIIGGNIVVHLQ